MNIAPEDKPQPQNPFAYFFNDNESVLDELEKLGIRFCACNVDGDMWPALVMPSGKVLALASDPEATGQAPCISSTRSGRRCDPIWPTDVDRVNRVSKRAVPFQL